MSHTPLWSLIKVKSEEDITLLANWALEKGYIKNKDIDFCIREGIYGLRRNKQVHLCIRATQHEKKEINAIFSSIIEPKDVIFESTDEYLNSNRCV